MTTAIAEFHPVETYGEATVRTRGRDAEIRRVQMSAASGARAAGRPRKRKPRKQYWYVSHPSLRTREGQDEARRIAGMIADGEPVEDSFGQAAIFRALHTSAYWAAGSSRTQQISAATRRRWARRWRIIREHLMESNLGLVHTTLSRFRTPQVDHDELLSDALIALQRAVERFNPHRGFKFSTYACNCIIRACMRSRKNLQERHQRFPVQFEPSMEKATEEPDDDLGLRLERLEHVLRENKGELSDLEADILSQRFPRGNRERLTFKEIARAIGLSKERVRQIQNGALEKLRGALEADPLVDAS